jgi:hypothetical protein
MIRGAAAASLLLALAVGSCRGGGRVPESGAVLLRLQISGEGPAPDELRLWIYDDTGTLWNDVRFPSEGALAPPHGNDLGTILIQPGAVTGRLRIHARALAGGARLLDGTLAIPPDARATSPALELVPEPLDDGDGDGVPDDIDDCIAAPNPAQGGCATGGGAGSGGAAGVGAGVGGTGGDGGGGDAGGPDASVCNGAAVCDLPAGASCGLDADCASGFCADGVCCVNACLGSCRSCNQPGADGACQPYALATDPERECGDGACNGAGACGPAAPPTNKPNGSTCAGASECGSGFCTDGVCCSEACNGACLSCATGTCTKVKNRADAPQCVAPMTCSNTGKCVGGG